MSRPRVVAVVGATATGKTELGESLADSLGGEIVCADSRQVYRELEVGTGKPTRAQRETRPHHLFDALSLAGPSSGWCPPAAVASAGWYARVARVACQDILARGRTPVLVGGSGLYLAALQRGLAPTPRVPSAVRERVRAALAEHGPAALHQQLARSDPETAARLAPRDAQRVARALEVLEASGHPLSWWHARPGADALAADWRVLELVVPPARLARRIAARTVALFEAGLVDETRALIAAGLAAPLARLHAVGYDEAAELLAGRCSVEAARERVSLRTRQLAKRQRTWFRHQVEAVRIEVEHETPAARLAAARRALGATAAHRAPGSATRGPAR